jgi:lipoic acid synthetase
MITISRPLPPEYKREIPAGPLFNRVKDVLEAEKLNTICVSGKCPNRGECFSRGSLAFMILGDTCTRHCGFCAVKAGNPAGVVDWDEPTRLAQAVKALGLRHAVITAVARDDLKDGGAAVFAACIKAVRRASPKTVIEALTSDFEGQTEALDVVLEARPDIFNHNIETVERLTPKVRSKATYRRSLEVLKYAKQRHSTLTPTPLPQQGEGKTCLRPIEGECGRRPDEGLKTKSGLMLGLGETKEEILQTLKDLRSAGCDYLTIGQYLQPSAQHLSIQYFVPMEDFRAWKETALSLGFERAASGPLVRSSYFADELHAPL